MSNLSPEDRAFLEAHMKVRELQRQRLPSKLAQQLRGAAAATESARLQLAHALNPKLQHDERLEHARAAVAALPDHLVELQRQQLGPKRFARRAGRLTADVAAAVHDALERRVIGPRAARGNSGVYVQQEDLEDLVPDGWGEKFTVEITRLARRAGVPPAAVPLLNLLTWCAELLPPEPGSRRRRCGAGSQFSIAWLSRKLGYSPSWIKVLFNRLDPFAEHRRLVAAVKRENARRDRRKQGERHLKLPTRPTGTAYVHRFRRLLPYAELPKRDGVRAACWIDKLGRTHFYVDVRGVAYITDAGRRLLVRRARAARPMMKLHGFMVPRPGVAPELRRNGTLTDLELRLRKLRWRIRARLRAGHAAVERSVEKSPLRSTGPPRRATALR